MGFKLKGKVNTQNKMMDQLAILVFRSGYLGILGNLIPIRMYMNEETIDKIKNLMGILTVEGDTVEVFAGPQILEANISEISVIKEYIKTSIKQFKAWPEDLWLTISRPRNENFFRFAITGKNQEALDALEYPDDMWPQKIWWRGKWRKIPTLPKGRC